VGLHKKKHRSKTKNVLLVNANSDFGRPITTTLKNTKIRFFRWLYSIYFILLMAGQTAAQSETEVLRRQLDNARGRMAYELQIKLAKAYYEINPDSSIYLAREVLREHEKELPPMAKADAHNVISTAFQLQARYAEALAEARKAQDIYQVIGDSNGISSVLSTIGTIFYYRSNYQLALDHYLRALRYKEALKQENGVASLRCNIGNIYINQRQFEQARLHYEQAQEVFARLGNQRGVGYTHNNLGVIFEETGELDKAISSYVSAFEIDKALGDKFGMASSYFNLAEIYRKTNRLALAKEHYEASLKLSQETANRIDIARSLSGLAKLSLRKNDYREAITLAADALEISNTANTNLGKRTALEILTEAYERQNQPQRSLDYYKMLVAVKDSIRTEETNLMLTETQTRYETERREQEFALLQKDKSLQDSRLNRQKLLNKVYIGAIGTVVLLLFFIINRYQLIRRNEDMLRSLNASLEEKVNDRTRDLRAAFEKAERADRLKTFFLSNINHELRTPMNGIIGMSEYLRENIQQPETKQVAEHLIESGKRLSETMSAILELSSTEANPKELVLAPFNPEQVVRKVLTRFQSEFEAKGLKVDFINYAGDQTLHSNAVFVERILLNLVENAIKFTQRGFIKIELIRELWAGEPTYSIRVQDSGAGIPSSSLREIFDAFRTSDDQIARGYEGLGIGLTLSRKYADVLNGQISVDSREGQGSVFTLRLPLK
jgi:two-component system, sensor histidine kinase